MYLNLRFYILKPNQHFNILKSNLKLNGNTIIIFTSILLTHIQAIAPYITKEVQ